MTEQQTRSLGVALTRFLGLFLYCCKYTQTFYHMGTYVRGLLSDLPRKSVEPIALYGGTVVRTLQLFLTKHVWNFIDVRRLFQRHVASVLPSVAEVDDLGNVGIIDETGTPKKGDHTPGVQRQWCGRLGKVDNCVVTVHLGVCRGRYKTLVDADLFLPESWSCDRKRCRAAGIPDDVVHRPKWKIALEQIDRAKTEGILLNWLTFDEEYGKAPGFVAGLDKRLLSFVGEVPRTLSCLAAHKSGRRPPEGATGRHAEDVVHNSSAFRKQSWQVVRLSRETLQDQIWRVKAARVWLASAEGWSAGTYWLIWASNDATGEEKFFLSNAAETVKVTVMLRVAFRRWNVEHAFRVGKSELGFGHFEGRSWVALMRHLSLSLVAMGFVAEHTERFRGEKCRGDDGAGVPNHGPDVPVLVA